MTCSDGPTSRTSRSPERDQLGPDGEGGLVGLGVCPGAPGCRAPPACGCRTPAGGRSPGGRDPAPPAPASPAAPESSGARGWTTARRRRCRTGVPPSTHRGPRCRDPGSMRARNTTRGLDFRSPEPPSRSPSANPVVAPAERCSAAARRHVPRQAREEDEEGQRPGHGEGEPSGERPEHPRASKGRARGRSRPPPTAPARGRRARRSRGGRRRRADRALSTAPPATIRSEASCTWSVGPARAGGRACAAR